jgi:hypothetical protein
LTVLSGVAEFERGLILQWTNEGRAPALAEVHVSAISRSWHQAREALKLVAAGEPLREIALSCAVDRLTISRLKATHFAAVRLTPGVSQLGREDLGKSGGLPPFALDMPNYASAGTKIGPNLSRSFTGI